MFIEIGAILASAVGASFIESANDAMYKADWQFENAKSNFKEAAKGFQEVKKLLKGSK